MLIVHSFEEFDDDEEIDKDRVIAHLFKIIMELDPSTTREDIALLVMANMTIEDMEQEEDDLNFERN
tara:strand:- start:1955 stop:2155 length:201 start_codon:yes stop_codon:yes gene_type:complete